MNDEIAEIAISVDVKVNRGAGSGLIVIGLLALGLFIMCIIALVLGQYPIGFHDLFTTLWQNSIGKGIEKESANYLVLFNVRMPRMLAAIIVGAALSGSGACYQVIFRNPMVEPSLLGVTAGSAFGAALGILFSFGIMMIQFTAFAFGLTAVLITVTLSSLVNRNGDKTLTLVLCGIVTGTLFASFLSLAKYLADPYSKLPVITYWLMGSLASINMADIRFASVCCLTGLIPLMFLRWRN